MKEVISNVLFNYEFVFAFLFCSIIFLLISIFTERRIIKKIFIVLFSVFFALFSFELVLSFFNDKINMNFHKTYINTENILEIKKDKHIKILSNNKTYEFYNKNFNNDIFKNYAIIFDSEYSIYRNTHFRFTKCNIGAKQTYVFLGCSFVFGLGLDDDKTLPCCFSKKFNFKKNVVNCSVSGQSTNTALNILNNYTFEKLIQKNSKIKHCFYFLIKDHIYRNFRYEDNAACIDGYLYKDNKWYIPTALGKIKYIFARSYIFRKVFLPVIDGYFEQYYEDYMIKSLEEINTMVERKYNSKLTIVVWTEFLSESFVNKLKKTELDLIFLLEYFNSEEDGYKIKHDGHPTAKANEEIAEILYNHINNK